MASDSPAGRVALKNRSYVRQASAEDEVSDDAAASARWKKLKERHQQQEEPAPARRTANRPAQILPIPEESDEALDADELLDTDENSLDDLDADDEAAVAKPRQSLSVKAATARPIAPDEPLPITEFEDSPDWILGAQPLPADSDEEPAPRIAAQPDDGLAVDSAQPDESELAPTPDADDNKPAQPVTRRPRRIDEISPKYDVNVDQDIRVFAKEQAKQYGVSFGAGTYPPRAFAGSIYQWEPSNFYHYPLYFEDPALERYGHTHGDCLQPVASLARFGTQLVFLPYQMTIDPICHRQYALGWYRPGECAPKLHYQPPLNAHAAAVEAGVVTGLFFLIP